VRAARENPRYAFVEFDVQYSADRIAIVIHDDNLLRVFRRISSVKKFPFKILRELSGNEIAAYQDIMDLAEGKRVNIEIKSQGDDAVDRQLIDMIMEDVRRRGIESDVLISSISEEAVAYVKTRYPEMKAGQVFFIKASTWLPFDFLTEGLYRTTPADYIMLYTANLRNIKDLIALKPENKTLVFWDFGDTMYIVHKDASDRLWGQSAAVNLLNEIRFQLARPFAFQ
jgi:glycerophosphoryl diester phosphodiesterase